MAAGATPELVGPPTPMSGPSVAVPAQRNAGVMKHMRMECRSAALAKYFLRRWPPPARPSSACRRTPPPSRGGRCGTPRRRWSTPTAHRAAHADLFLIPSMAQGSAPGFLGAQVEVGAALQIAVGLARLRHPALPHHLGSVDAGQPGSGAHWWSNRPLLPTNRGPAPPG